MQDKEAVTAYFNTFTATPITWRAEVYCVPVPTLSHDEMLILGI
jgi:hypothetical protein